MLKYIELKEVLKQEDNSNDWLKVYHATSQFALERIKEEGKIGVSIDEYISIARSILNDMNLPESKIEKYMERVVEDEDSNWGRGVSFWQEKKPFVYRMAKPVGEGLGEGYGSFIEETVKYGARVLKDSYKNWIHQYMPDNNNSVLLTLKVNSSVIENQKDIGNGFELYTSRPLRENEYEIIEIEYV